MLKRFVEKVIFYAPYAKLKCILKILPCLSLFGRRKLTCQNSHPKIFRHFPFGQYWQVNLVGDSFTILVVPKIVFWSARQNLFMWGNKFQKIDHSRDWRIWSHILKKSKSLNEDFIFCTVHVLYVFLDLRTANI